MNAQDLAYANQELAGLLKTGVPLEGALRRLCRDLRRGRLKHELELLEQDLAQGTPLAEAVQRRRLPALYVNLIRIGASSGRLPEVLGMLADYYQQLNLLGMRLRGLLVYPILLLGIALVVSVVVAMFMGRFVGEMGEAVSAIGGPTSNTPLVSGSPIAIWLRLWAPTAGLAVLAGIVLLCLVLPGLRDRLRWRLPGFREAALTRLASSVALLLRNGCSLKETFELLQQLEGRSRLGREIARWHERLAAGKKTFAELTEGTRLLPPLFVWVVSGSGEDWAAGFTHAAELYQTRMQQWHQLLLAAALPAATVFVALVLIGQLSGIFRTFLAIWRAFFRSLTEF